MGKLYNLYIYMYNIFYFYIILLSVAFNRQTQNKIRQTELKKLHFINDNFLQLSYSYTQQLPRINIYIYLKVKQHNRVKFNFSILYTYYITV